MRPGRDRLAGMVETDETYIGGEESGLPGGRARGKKVLTGIAVEIREPRGFGRCRMLPLADASAAALHPFVTDHVEPGATIITDGWQGYRGLEKLGYVHDPVRYQDLIATKRLTTGSVAPTLSRPLSRCHLQRLSRFIHSGWPSGRGKLDSNGTARVGGGHRGVTEIVRSLESTPTKVFLHRFKRPSQWTTPPPVRARSGSPSPVCPAGSRVSEGQTDPNRKKKLHDKV